MSDLSGALSNYGINVDKLDYYANTPTTGNISIPKWTNLIKNYFFFYVVVT